MASFNIPAEYILWGLVNSGSTVLGAVQYESDSLTCTDIQGALTDLHSPDSYPVECDFITLTNTGVVFFMDPETEMLTTGIEVSISASTESWISTEDVQFVYTIETAFIILVIWINCIARNIRKFAPKTIK